MILERSFAIKAIPDMSMAVRDTRISRPSDEAGVMLPYVFNQIGCTPELIAIVCASVAFYWPDVSRKCCTANQYDQCKFFVAFDSFSLLPLLDTLAILLHCVACLFI